MNLFGETDPLGEIDLIASSAWEESDPEEIERREHNRLVNRVRSFAEELDFTVDWQDDAFCFLGGYTGATASFPLTIAGLNDAIAWLEQQAEQYEGPAIVRCPYCGHMHQADQVENCGLKPKR